MSAVDPRKLEILKELQSRRSTLTPDKIAIVDELSARWGVQPSVASKRPIGASGAWSPEPGIGAGLRELALQGMEEIGIDPASPVLGTVRNVVKGAHDISRRLFPNAPQFQGAPGGLGPMMFGIPEPTQTASTVGELAAVPITEPINIGGQIREGWDERDIEKFGGGLGRAAGYVGGLALGGKKAKPAAKALLESIPEPRSVRLGRTALDELGQPIPPRAPISVEIAGEIPKGELIQFHPSVNQLAEGLGGKAE